VVVTTHTKERTMSDLTRTIDTHLAAYGEPDATKRAALVRQVWSAEGQLLDPPIEGTGHDGIAALGDIVQAHYAGHTFRRTSAVDAHHGFARYGWDLVAPDGSVAMSGIDVVQVDDDGRLVRIVGFFGPLADAA
jgi:hypothetical protein